MSLLSQPGKPVWNYLVLMYKQGGKEEETGKRSRRSKQASCSHPSFKGDFYLMCLFSQSTVRLHKRFGEKSAQEDGVPWFKKVQISFFQCRLRLLKEERIKDYLLMEEEFISNQVDAYTQICPECCLDASKWSKPLLVLVGMILKRCSCLLIQNWRNVQERLKPQEEKNEEERTKVSSADMLFCPECSLQQTEINHIGLGWWPQGEPFVCWQFRGDHRRQSCNCIDKVCVLELDFEDKIMEDVQVYSF